MGWAGWDLVGLGINLCEKQQQTHIDDYYSLSIMKNFILYIIAVSDTGLQRCDGCSSAAPLPLPMAKTCGGKQDFVRAKSNHERRKGAGERWGASNSRQRFWSLPDCLALVLEQHTTIEVAEQYVPPSSAEEVGGGGIKTAAAGVRVSVDIFSCHLPPPSKRKGVHGLPFDVCRCLAPSNQAVQRSLTWSKKAASS